MEATRTHRGLTVIQNNRACSNHIDQHGGCDGCGFYKGGCCTMVVELPPVPSATSSRWRTIAIVCVPLYFLVAVEVATRVGHAIDQW